MADDLLGKRSVVDRVVYRVGFSGLREIRGKGDIDQDVLLGLAFLVVDADDAAQQQVFNFNPIFRHGISLDSSRYWALAHNRTLRMDGAWSR